MTATALERPSAEDSRRAPGRWLSRRTRGARTLLSLAAGCGIAGGLLLIAQAALIATALSGAVMDGKGLADLSPVLGALLAVYAARALCAWGLETAGAAGAERIKTTIRRELAAHITALGPVRVAERQAGGLAATLMEQVEALEGFFARFLPQLVVAVAVPPAMLAAVASVDWLAALILAFAAPLIPLFMALIGMGAASLSRQQMQALARMGGYFLDRLQGLTTLKLFRQDERELARIAEVSQEFRQRTMRVLRVAFLSSAVLEFFSSVAIAMLAIYIGFALLGFYDFGPASEMTLFTGLFILLLAPDFFQPLRQLAQHYHDRAAALGAAKEILNILEQPAPPRPSAPAPIPRRRPAEATLENVTVRFAGRPRPALKDFSLHLRAGERVALVGPSGSGKSTVINLLLGVIQPGAGRVAINGCALTQADPEEIAGTSAWLGQRAHVFHGTIRDNIRLARPEADDAAVERAAERARVMDFARALPHGLDTPVGERGFGLSGGQAQRVALARAILKDAPLLLLDEPTANLDPENERLVLEGLSALAAEGRTVLIATHTAAGIGFADRQVVIAPAAVEGEPR